MLRSFQYYRTIEEAAADVVTSVINEAVEEKSKTFAGNDPDLFYEYLSDDRGTEIPRVGCNLSCNVTLEDAEDPAIDGQGTCECLATERWIFYMSEKIKHVIEIVWKLECPFTLRFVKLENDENSEYYFFEAIFSIPTKMYPIPQVTVSVFFKFERSLSYCEELIKVRYFLEGGYRLLDPKHVHLSSSSLVSVMKAKLAIFKFIEMNEFS